VQSIWQEQGTLTIHYSSIILLARAKIKTIEVFMSGRADEVIRGVEGVLPGESATARAAHESLKGDRRGIRKLLPFLGPAFIAAVAYVDPGNFATNISGGALALNLLFGIPLFPAGLLTAVGAFGILELQRRGFRPLEAVIAAMVGVIVVAFAFQMFYAEPEVDRVLAGLFTPGFAGTESVLLAAGILGATVMPHVIYLHSALTQRRVVGKTEEEKRKIFRFELVDVVLAMAIAGTINASMLIMAAALFHSAGLTGVGDIDKAFEQLRILEGNTPAILFGVALLASGLSSSSVGTLSGQVVMQGFISRQIPLFLRRLITMMPALIILAIGLNPSRSLVISQVVLSFGIPFALVPLLIFCRNRDVMGTLVNHRLTTTVATVVVFLIVSLNVFLLYQTFFSA